MDVDTRLAVGAAPDAFVEGAAAAREEIRQLIHTWELAPGSRINELGLSQRLGVGRNVVRQALRALEPLGLVRFVPNRGAEVRKINLEEALDLSDVRACLARAAARSAALRAKPEEIRSLEELHARMRDLAAAQRHEEYLPLNDAFHAAIVDAARNERLQLMLLAVEDEMRLYLRAGISAPGEMARSHAEHGAILEAIKAGDAQDAADLFEAHILHGKQRLIHGARELR
jgi:DNA-binding GntR family transcriptional regulator